MSIEITGINTTEMMKKVDDEKAFVERDKYAVKIKDELLKKGMTIDEIKDVFTFILCEFTPGFERFMVKVVKEKTGKNIASYDIVPWDKTIFPNGTKDFVKYLKLYVNEWQKGNITILSSSSSRRDYTPDLKNFLKYYPYIKPYFLKIMELSVASVNVLNRIGRSQLIIKDLDSLKKDIKNN